VFLSEPGQTSYDLTFSLFGFPVRVHPAFFIAPLLFGQGLIKDADNVGLALIVVTIIFFLSILLHELGHSLAFQRFGIDSRIVLHWMGGLAIPDNGNPWGGRRKSQLTPNEQMIVSFAGPLANFAIAGAALGIGLAMGGGIFWPGTFIPMPFVNFNGTMFQETHSMSLLFNGSILLNILWAILNLMPVYPLDGGQMARAFMTKIDPTTGIQNSIYLSLGTAVLLIVFSLTRQSQFMAIFFGFMAYSNFQMLQSMNGPRW
jgi:Zn-dependent protease